MLSKVLDKIIEVISIYNFDDTKILFTAYDKLPDDIILRIFMISMMMMVSFIGKYI